jgi:hypothetical protein
MRTSDTFFRVELGGVVVLRSMEGERSLVAGVTIV